MAMSPMALSSVLVLAVATVQTAAGATSTPNVDVLGIKLGVSNVVDVRAALGKVTPPVLAAESHAQLSGTDSSDGRAGSIEYGRYVARLRATTKGFQVPGKEGCSQPVQAVGTDCEAIDIIFSAPPEGGTAAFIGRVFMS